MQETENSVHWELLLATLQRKKFFVLIGDFSHGDCALAANEMPAGPVETDYGFENVTADDALNALNANRNCVVSYPVHGVDVIYHLTGPRSRGILFDSEGPASD